MNRIIFLFLFFTPLSFSQSKTITGIVSDSLNAPLESANLIALPRNSPTAQLRFSITDKKGRFKLDLDANVGYEITASYIGFMDTVLLVEPNSTNTLHNFKLKASGEKLKEIIIKNDFKPIEVKKDTLTFDLKSFVNGNERKMKDALLKLPGVEVDKKGNVFVQGKKVTKMLVEGKSFFGGGSKLAVENIPADALDKIEVIDHFTEVNFMKKVSDSDDLAINVKLKANKKMFIFGDVTAGVEAGNGDNGFYLAHTGLFYYSPKTSISFIGDINNISKSTFTFDDLLRFEGGASSFLSGRKSFTNLYSLTDDNTDLVSNKSNFAAFNMSTDISKKINIIGYGIFSKIITGTKTENSITYLQNSFSNFENQFIKGNNQNTLGIANLKLDYSPNKLEKWFYNAQYQASNYDLKTTINSVSTLNSSVFETLNKADNISIKQYLEWHKSLSKKNTATFVINQAFEKSTSSKTWNSSQPFLMGLIPLQSDSNYNLNQLKNITNASVDVLLKHYYILNDYNLVYTSFGNNFGTSSLLSSENQRLSTGLLNDFNATGFGNDISYNLNDSYFNIEYKFKIGIWTNKPTLSFHNYNLKTNQFNEINTVDKILFQPEWLSELEFSKAETLFFNYKLTNEFPEIGRYANRFTLQNYNLVFKGNAILENQTFHSASLRYRKNNFYKGLIYNANLNFNKKVNSLRNEINLSGINQFAIAVLNPNPEISWRCNSSISKKIYRFIAKLNTNLNWLNYAQIINSVTTLNQRNNQDFGISVKTSYEKWADISVEYRKGLSQFSSSSTANFQGDEINADFETTFKKYFILKFEFQNLKNINDFNQSNVFNIANASIRYQKKGSPFDFELSANNLFDTKNKNNFSFSDYLINQSTTYILPRAILLSVSYKL